MRHTTKMAFKKETPDAHLQLAREKSARHITDMALARWTSGNTHVEMTLALAVRPSRLSQWHNTVQLNFDAWMAGGGFAAPVTGTPSQQAQPALDQEAPDAALRKTWHLLSDYQ
jgi:hypothetical protein